MNHEQLHLRQTDERGASAVEYGLLIAGIAAIVVLTIFLFGTFVGDAIDGSCETIAAENAVTGGTDTC